MCGGRPCSRWCELITEQDMHYCPEHWPYRPGSQCVAASDDAITIDPERMSDNARDPECLTVVSPGLRTVRPGTSSLHVSDDAMSIAIEPRACVCAPSGQARDPSRVLMLYGDDESEPKYANECPSEAPDDSSWREISDNEDDNSISAISPSPRVSPLPHRSAVAPVLARAETTTHEVVYDWTRGRFANWICGSGRPE